jgi:hypothetical protein
VIDENGTVAQVIVTNPGSGYLGPINDGTSPCNVNPVTSTGSEVLGFVVGVSIIRPGIGYATTDKIYDTKCVNDIEMYPVVDNLGKIIDVNITNPGSAVRVFPELAINTQNGEGAILKPILSFKPIEPVEPETDRKKIQTVILCAENHG